MKIDLRIEKTPKRIRRWVSRVATLAFMEQGAGIERSRMAERDAAIGHGFIHISHHGVVGVYE
jgi:hypothetical protein